METKAKIGEEVVIMQTAWDDDSAIFIGSCGILTGIEDEMLFATVRTHDMIEEGYVAVISYVRATPLLKALV
jgi:hypothetical protein